MVRLLSYISHHIILSCDKLVCSEAVYLPIPAAKIELNWVLLSISVSLPHDFTLQVVMITSGSYNNYFTAVHTQVDMV